MSLRQELGAHRVRQYHLDWLAESGVTGQDLVDVGGLGVASVRSVGDSALEFDDDGIDAFILPAYEDGELLDLVAFFVDRPARFSCLYCRVFALGIDYALNPSRLDDEVRVFRTPLEWLRHGGRGLVILDSNVAWNRLRDLDRLVAENAAHGRELHRLMQPPAWTGQILVPRKAAA